MLLKARKPDILGKGSGSHLLKMLLSQPKNGRLETNNCGSRGTKIESRPAKKLFREVRNAAVRETARVLFAKGPRRPDTRWERSKTWRKLEMRDIFDQMTFSTPAYSASVYFDDHLMRIIRELKVQIVLNSYLSFTLNQYRNVSILIFKHHSSQHIGG